MDWKNETWYSLGRFCGKQFPPTITTSGESMKILFRSNSAHQGDGFRVRNDFYLFFFKSCIWFIDFKNGHQNVRCDGKLVAVENLTVQLV